VSTLYRPIEKCRACGNSELVPVLDLGMQCLTGIFPRADRPDPAAGPLELVKCHGPADVCQLLQLRHIYDGSTMYGQDYGYRSSLNRSMVEHLTRKARGLMKEVELRQGDIVLDIGSNDGTSLSVYPDNGPVLIGIDPTAAKFKEFYPPHVRAVPEFFSADTFRKVAGGGPRQSKDRDEHLDVLRPRRTHAVHA
jgi:NDP-4-keto-2,6-dideoxyhexose 3-C-methyltransferase